MYLYIQRNRINIGILWIHDSNVFGEDRLVCLLSNIYRQKNRLLQTVTFNLQYYLFDCYCLYTSFFVCYFYFKQILFKMNHFRPRFYWFYEGKLYRWLQAYVAYWGYTAGYDVEEYGDDLTKYKNERVLLICNHQSTADVPTLMVILQSKGVASRKTLWLMDVLFRWTPFGVVAQMHGDHFIRQGKSTREKELLNLRNHLRKVFWDRDRRWVILFPEGGFYYKRFADSQRFGIKHGYPFLMYTTLPRLGAIKAIMEEVGPRENFKQENDVEKLQKRSKFQVIKDTVGELRDKKYIKGKFLDYIAENRPPIKYVLDVTIAYPNGKPLSLITLCLGTREKCNIAVNYKVFKADEVPFHDEEMLRNWLYKRYEEKDKILKHFYETGNFVDGEKGSVVKFSAWKIVGQHLFWCISVYLQYRAYKWVIFKIFYFIQYFINYFNV
uniref:PlsC domain-containing protein n=1 Tax=Syphacia muris TaxID=451379 RepID=A0A0N5AGA8_9BILA